MNDDLPSFRKRRYTDVMQFINKALTNSSIGTQSHLYRLIEFDDGHYRAIFKPTYFQKADGSIEPTKSQWGTLKKRMKRYQKSVFIFREHGSVDCKTAEPHESGSDESACFYIDFGFFAY